ncbi:MAG: radical SAM family heme chaperone HemW, partial [Chloroflexaceae bacterium]|nr:radical SAM family heme chaperone HemW [Chloroflexaceae bacterium]
IGPYVDALCAELAMLEPPPLPAAPSSNGHVPPLTSAVLRPTIFFGGGTPSMLTLDQFERILQAASRLVTLDRAEISIEANPGNVLGDATPALDYLRGVRSLGINRLSLGVQTLHDPTLRILGRTHSAADARTCYDTARRAGFDNISLDFIFGLPGQTIAQWHAILDEVAVWQPDHLSLYSLILEESTPLYAQVIGGRVSVPDDDVTGAMYEAAMERLAAAGYEQYEISNWARSTAAPAPGRVPTHACQHNLAYWLNSDYLAAGAGAHGHVYPQRYYDMLRVDAYIAAVREGRRPVAEVTNLTPTDLYAETVFMGLRLNVGLNLEHFRLRCGVGLDEVYGDTLADLQAQGLLERTADSVRLTHQGRMLGNRVFEAFV